MEADDELIATARECLDSLIERLPGTLRDEGRRVGYVLSRRDDSQDGHDTLGDYWRRAQQITVYLDAIHEYCKDENLDFCGSWSLHTCMSLDIISGYPKAS